MNGSRKKGLLELQFDVEQQDGGILQVLGLLLEACVAEGLLECHALHQLTVRHRPPGHLQEKNRSNGWNSISKTILEYFV